MRERVKFIAVVGFDASRSEDGIDELGVGDGSTAYEKLTSFHEDKTVEAVVAFAKALSDEFGDAVQIVLCQGIRK